MVDLILKNFARHVKLDQVDEAIISSALQHKLFKRKTTVLKAGSVCRAISFVIKGCLRVYHTDEDGKEHILLFAPEDWWVVDGSSFYSHTPAFYSIDALEDTEVFQLSYQDLEDLYRRVPKLERFFRILSQNLFIVYQRRLTESQSRPAEERYTAFKQLYPRLEQRIAQKHIASYLGITPVFLSMLRKRP